MKVTKTDKPEKALLFEVTVPAKLDDVWRAFTTKEGAQEWLWPDMTVELREGGDWIVHYPGGKTGGGTIVSFEPMQSITIARHGSGAVSGSAAGADNGGVSF